MLFEFENGIIDIVREKPYPGVVTIRSSSYEAVALYALMTPSKIVKVPDPIYPWILHLNEGNLPSEIDAVHLENLEILERLTPEPVAFAVEWTYKDELGQVAGDFDYCWPQDQDIAQAKVNYEYENLVESIKFLPLFEIPNKLLGLKGDVDED